VRKTQKVPKAARHPHQPLIEDAEGVVRFRRNAIVAFLLDSGHRRGIDMNMLALMEFSDEDRTQFAELTGYSLCGFGELPYVSDKAFKEAAAQKIHKTRRKKS
jgi:hypothetical protein